MKLSFVSVATTVALLARESVKACSGHDGHGHAAHDHHGDHGQEPHFLDGTHHHRRLLEGEFEFKGKVYSRCGCPGCPKDSVEELRRVDRLVQDWLTSDTGRRLQSNNSPFAKCNVEVETYIFVVWPSLDEAFDPAVQQTMNYLNSVFNSMGFHFKIEETYTIIDADWFDTIDEIIDDDRRAKHRKGDGDTLNIFIREPTGLLGYAWFPSWGVAKPQDTVTVHYGSMIDGFLTMYNEGKSPHTAHTL